LLDRESILQSLDVLADLRRTGLVIAEVAILCVFELALLGALFRHPPKRTRKLSLAQEAARSSPKDANFIKLGELVQEEENQSPWKNSVSLEYYAVIVFAMVVNGWFFCGCFELTVTQRTDKWYLQIEIANSKLPITNELCLAR
jgi:hypothetical protein